MSLVAANRYQIESMLLLFHQSFDDLEGDIINAFPFISKTDFETTARQLGYLVVPVAKPVFANRQD
jgi:hypothetical protein